MRSDLVSGWAVLRPIDCRPVQRGGPARVPFFGNGKLALLSAAGQAQGTVYRYVRRFAAHTNPLATPGSASSGERRALLGAARRFLCRP